MNKKQRIFIGIPCYQNVTAQTLEDYMRLMYHMGSRMPNYEFFLGVKSKSEQFRARNVIVSGAIDVGADWLLMIDDDQIFDVEGAMGEPGKGTDCYNFLEKLLAHDVDIVGPIYYQRGGTADPVVMRDGNQGGYIFMNESELTGGLQEVAVQGGGCILVKMKVFDQIKAPWFEPEHTYGTDIQLCRQARAAGFKVYTDSSIQIGHVYNDNVIVHAGNKDQYRDDTAKQAQTTVMSGWAAESMLNQYRQDAMIYLDIDREQDLKTLWDGYEAAAAKIAETYPVGTIGYYAKMGPEQLGRQVLYHQSDVAKKWAAYVLNMLDTHQEFTGLDYGCGSAPIGFELLKRGHNLTFVDVNGSKAFDFLQWRVDRYGLQERVIYFPYFDQEIYDYVMLNDVIEHLEDWKLILRNCIDSLKNYGTFITNYLLLENDGNNPEHINWERGEFVKFMYDHGMHQYSKTIWQKVVPIQKAVAI